MDLRVHESGRLVTGAAGRVHIARYVDLITLDLAHRAQADYVEFCESRGGPVPIVLITERVIPLPAIEVRRYWREAANQPPGFEAIALLMGGVMGLMAAAATHLGEQLVEVLGVRFRSFKQPDDAARWLCESLSCEIDQAELAEAIDQLRAIDAPADPHPDPGP